MTISTATSITICNISYVLMSTTSFWKWKPPSRSATWIYYITYFHVFPSFFSFLEYFLAANPSEFSRYQFSIFSCQCASADSISGHTVWAMLSHFFIYTYSMAHDFMDYFLRITKLRRFYWILVTVQYPHSYGQKSMKIAFGNGIFACFRRVFLRSAQ